VLTVIGLVTFWPSGSTQATTQPASGAAQSGGTQAFGGSTLGATVDSSSTVDCQGPVPQSCRQIVVTPSEGPQAGTRQTITLGPSSVTPPIGVGDHIRVLHVPLPPGANPETVEQYQFVDFDRHGSLIWLAIGFGLLALLVARWRGALALIGLGLSLLLVVEFLVPAMLHGSSPVLVSLTAAFTVMFIMLVLTSGVSAQSLAAALGIAGSLALATLLADAYVHFSHLNGYTGELSNFITGSGLHVSLEGIVIAGMVIGALGVLADMAVTQASAVMALRRANPQLNARALYREAFAVGRDHLSATINTLVLAYVGATLPLLLVLNSAGVGAGDALNGQDLAEPIAATLIGSIGLIASVPLTTALAALLASRVPPGAIPEHAHAH
jgi:uncharacterized membrane protein